MDCLSAWWQEKQPHYRHLEELVINLDGGGHSQRSYPLYRLTGSLFIRESLMLFPFLSIVRWEGDFNGVPMLSLLANIPITAYVYFGLVGAFLLVMPLFVYLYLEKRWYVASSIERLVMYFMVFLFFPGMLLLSPFLNFRPHRHKTIADQ